MGGFGILATLWYVQSYRRNGRWPSLVLAALAAGLAGGFWSAGHLAGPVAAVYLWLDGRRRCRWAAAVPVAATAAAVALMLSMATRPMDSRISFHGRTIAEAFHPVQGAIITAQAIPEDLILGNLGLEAHTSPIQGILLTLGLILLWASRRWRRNVGRPGSSIVRRRDDHRDVRRRSAGALGPAPAVVLVRVQPAGMHGAAIVLGCYMLEWTFRGYFDYQYLRTHNMYTIVPWYDEIPQVGAVLFVIGWWSGPRPPAGWRARRRRSAPDPPSRYEALALLVLTLALIALNRPRVDALIRRGSPPLLASERELFKTPRLQTMRANLLLSLQVEWQRKYLRRLDQAEPVAQRLGIGQDGIAPPSARSTSPARPAGCGRPCTNSTTWPRSSTCPPAAGSRTPRSSRGPGAATSVPTSNLGRTGSHQATNGAGLVGRSPTSERLRTGSLHPSARRRGEVLEAGEALEERQLDRLGAPVAVLGDDQLGDPGLVVGVVVIGSMKK